MNLFLSDTVLDLFTAVLSPYRLIEAIYGIPFTHLFLPVFMYGSSFCPFIQSATETSSVPEVFPDSLVMCEAHIFYITWPSFIPVTQLTIFCLTSFIQLPPLFHSELLAEELCSGTLCLYFPRRSVPKLCYLCFELNQGRESGSFLIIYIICLLNLWIGMFITCSSAVSIDYKSISICLCL